MYLIVVAVYVLGMLLGSAFILCVPFFNHREALLMIAESRGEYTLTHFVDYPHPTFGTEFYLFRDDGEFVTSDQHFLSDGDAANLPDYLPELLAKGQLYKIRRYELGNVGERSDKVFCIIAGVVLEGSTGRRFGSIVVRDLNDIDISFETFAGLYTLIFAVAVYLLTRISRQHAEVMNLQRDLVSNVSHELKTPITSIKAMGELLYDGMYRSEDEMKHYVSSILTESDRLKDLVKEILELGRLQSHRADIAKIKCYADGVFEPVVDRYKMLCGDISITLDDTALELDRLPPLYTDPKHISRVMSILLENAVKFVGPGGTITLSARPQARHTVFCVADNGPGIDPEIIDRIFERFYKADVTHNSQGSGLGLSIASETIKSLGEKIWVESTVGEGASFFFTVKRN